MNYYISVLIFCLLQSDSRAQVKYDTATIGPVKYASWHIWAAQVGNSHLAAMTAELVRDSIGKMRTAQQEGKKYEKNVMFKIGSVASSLQSLFDKLVHMYRDVSNLTEFRNKDWTQINSLNKTMTAVSMAQSLLHRIRLEKKLFLEILKDDHERKFDEQSKALKKYGPPPKDIPLISRPKGGMFVPRRSNDWFEEDFVLKFDLPASLPKTRRTRTKDSNGPSKTSVKKYGSDKKPQPLVPKPGDDMVSTKAAELPVNPYSDLAHLLSESGAGKRSRSNLLSLLPSGVREDEMSPSSGRLGDKMKAKQNIHNKLLNWRRDNIEAAVQGPSSNRRFYDSHEKSPRESWHPELPFENQKSDIRRSSVADSVAQLPLNSRRSVDNHEAAIVEQPLYNKRSDKTTAELNRNVTPQKVLWRPAANQQRWYDKHNEAVHRPTNRETAHPYNQRSHDDVEASKQLSKNRPQHNEGKAKRVVWRPSSNSRRVYDKNGDAISQQPTYNNGADQQPLSNRRSNVNNHEPTASKPRRSGNRNDKTKPQRVLWQPSLNQQQRWYDKNGQAFARRPSENHYRPTGQQHLSN